MNFKLSQIAFASFCLAYSNHGLAQASEYGFIGTTSSITNPSLVSVGAENHAEGNTTSPNSSTLSGYTVNINSLVITGTNGGDGSYNPITGSVGDGGRGGGSIFGVVTSPYSTSAFTTIGAGGGGQNNTVNITGTTEITGGLGGAGGNSVNYASGGMGGLGGGLIVAAFSMGANGIPTQLPQTMGDGGYGGDVLRNTINISGDLILNGQAGGAGGEALNGPSGMGGLGGGSIYGAISIGGSGGHSYSTAISSTNGGDGGDASWNTVIISGSAKLFGGDGGDSGANNAYGTTATGGNAGGSIYGSLSIGGNGGYSRDTSGTAESAKGGNGGNASHNTLQLNNITLNPGTAGKYNTNQTLPNNFDGLEGGSVFGGASLGGTGGYNDSHSGTFVGNGDGGNGGEASHNTIEITGTSKINGNVYGGYTRGGTIGDTINKYGTGGVSENNKIILSGKNINIVGTIFGGFSINGDGSDSTYTSGLSKATQGNTLELKNYQGSVAGIKNIEKYDWNVAASAFSSTDPVIQITGATAVDLTNTTHTLALIADGGVIDVGSRVLLIDKAQSATGNPQLTNSNLSGGYFETYSASLSLQGNSLYLDIGSKTIKQNTPAWLDGRMASTLLVDQGADMISDHGINAARASLKREKANFFAVADGGSNRYKTSKNSHIKINDTKLAVGAALNIDMGTTGFGVVGAFAEHGTGNFNSHSQFDQAAEVSGSGKARYTGAGALFHFNILNNQTTSQASSVGMLETMNGTYVNGAVRFGTAKSDFESADLANAAGAAGRYNTKSKYYTAILGAGHVLPIMDKASLDVYGRYTLSHFDKDDVTVGSESFTFAANTSKRLRLGARMTYAYSDSMKPYVGLAYERNLSGAVGGVVRGTTLGDRSFKGNTGVLDFGVLVKPVAKNDNFTMKVGVQTHFGQRKGATAAVNLKVAF